MCALRSRRRYHSVSGSDGVVRSGININVKQRVRLLNISGKRAGAGVCPC